MRRTKEFRRMPWFLRLRLRWGTRYRIATFALGLPAGVISFLYVLYQGLQFAFDRPNAELLPLPLLLWLTLVGFLWINSIFIGAWYNISTICQVTGWEMIAELSKVFMVAPVAGIMESTAAFWAVIQWSAGKRDVKWQPTPKTGAADKKAIAKGAPTA